MHLLLDVGLLAVAVFSWIGWFRAAAARHEPERSQAANLDAELFALQSEMENLQAMLTARAQAIIDRIVALGAHINSKVKNDEAAHDAANTAAADADDSAIESALGTLETSVGADPTPANVISPPLPPADASAAPEPAPVPQPDPAQPDPNAVDDSSAPADAAATSVPATPEAVAPGGEAETAPAETEPEEAAPNAPAPV